MQCHKKNLVFSHTSLNSRLNISEEFSSIFTGKSLDSFFLFVFYFKLLFFFNFYSIYLGFLGLFWLFWIHIRDFKSASWFWFSDKDFNRVASIIDCSNICVLANTYIFTIFKICLSKEGFSVYLILIVYIDVPDVLWFFIIELFYLRKKKKERKKEMQYH